MLGDIAGNNYLPISPMEILPVVVLAATVLIVGYFIFTNGPNVR
jgi:hypothetical protein